MRNVTLILAGLASLGLGVLGGMATDPVMLPPKDTDWRAKYRTDGRGADDPAATDYSADSGGYGYGPAYPQALAGLVRRAEWAVHQIPELADYDPTPILESPFPRGSARQALGDMPPEPAPPPTPSGRDIVADALERTKGIAGETEVQAGADPLPGATMADQPLPPDAAAAEPAD